jgi:hypothetical protein
MTGIFPLKKMRSRKALNIGIWIGILLLASSCQDTSSRVTPTPEVLFVPPTPGPYSFASEATSIPPPPTQQGRCKNQLKYLKDLTIPDGSEVAPGKKITKRWLISNEGSCNWDQSYSFQLISGLALGAEKVQELYPVRQGAKAVVEITFTAPDNPGRYNSWWQAFDPKGGRFGDSLYMDIMVVKD